MLWAAFLALVVQADPPVAPPGSAPAPAYHRILEQNRLRRATAMAARGDCVAAVAYAERTGDDAVLVATRRLCPAGIAGAPILAAPQRPPTAEEEVAAFAADGRHPLFALVRHDMSRLIGEGRAADLQAAYDQAVAARAARFRAQVSPQSLPRP